MSITNELTSRLVSICPFLPFFNVGPCYLINVLPTPRCPWQNNTELSDSPRSLVSDQRLNSSVCKSHSPASSARRSWISWCRNRGSSGDSQVKIWDRSSAIVQLFPRLTTVFKELTLLLKSWDIFYSSLLGVLYRYMMDDGVSRLPKFLGVFVGTLIAPQDCPMNLPQICVDNTSGNIR